MQKKVYVDTSALILLTNINELSILKLVYGSVYITIPIWEEFKHKVPWWINLGILGKGEASLLSVAAANKDVFLILDDYKARKLATLYKINFTGTLGVLIIAKQLGYINKIKPFLDKINLTNFRLSSDLQAKALLLARE
jgi:predicted nucleic acid-binding protein